jgi:hypothetical protein
MLDDFSALDLLSIGGFRLSSGPIEVPPTKKKRFGSRRKSKSGAKRRLVSFLPLIGSKIYRPGGFRGLAGWPITLSWPTKEVVYPELWSDQNDRPIS